MQKINLNLQIKLFAGWVLSIVLKNSSICLDQLALLIISLKIPTKEFITLFGQSFQIIHTIQMSPTGDMREICTLIQNIVMMNKIKLFLHFQENFQKKNQSLSIDFTSHLSLAHLRYEIDRIKSSIITIFYSQKIASLDEKTAFEISKKIPFLVNHFPVMLRKKCLTKYNPLFLYLDKTLTNQNLKRDVIYENASYFNYLDPDEKRILELIEAAIFSKKFNLPNLVKNLKKIQILNLDFSLMHDKKIFDSIWLRYKSLLNEKDPLILAAHKKKILDLVP